VGDTHALEHGCEVSWRLAAGLVFAALRLIFWGLTRTWSVRFLGGRTLIWRRERGGPLRILGGLNVFARS
jgi:hypothetical protein